EAATGVNLTTAREISKDPALRVELELLKEFQFAGQNTLTSAPQELLQKALSIAKEPAGRRRTGAVGRIREIIGDISFDSWVMPSPVGVRSAGELGERRLRLEAEGLKLDLRAEKGAGGWDFVGRISGPLAERELFVALIGARRISPADAGFYQWSSSRGPRTISLRSEHSHITFTGLSWSKPARK
ncbi:MAG: hypothetical protein ACE5GA_10275, partial [Candidatus Zixiibacteriota bacterium]